MFLGHFALGVATKPAAPKLPIWALFLAPQAMDLVFLGLGALGVEGSSHGDYGQSEIDATYSHSIVGALAIAGLVFWIARKVWKSERSAWIMAALALSHWPIDLFVHHEDLPILPGNLGDLPMLGFGLWDYPRAILTIEAVLAIAAAGLYFNWARTQPHTRYRYVGPAIITTLFGLMAYSDLARLPA